MKPVRYYNVEQLKAMTVNRKHDFLNLQKALKKMKHSHLDHLVQQLHKEAFKQFDCLDCANCCSSISPIITEKDAERLAKSQRQKAGSFISEYLHIDEDNDYVFKQTPCPFLMADNYCSAYADRPKACREYPHTNRIRFHQILMLSLKNCEICPIVYSIFDELSSTI